MLNKEQRKQYEEATASYTGVYKEGFSSSSRRTFTDVGPNRSVRPAFNRGDYDSFREDSAVPTSKRQSIKMCMEAYKNVGIIRNIIDLMGDFACQGVNLVHRDKSVESFYKQWFKKVRGKERSERFLNNLYRTGNPVVYRSYAKVSPKMSKLMKSMASDVKIEDSELDVEKNKIPFRYNFFNPLSLDIIDGELCLNVTNQAKIMSDSGYNASFKTSVLPKHVMDTLPKGLQNQIKNNKKQIKLDADRLVTAHYKKDDWESWADPIVHAILDDIMMLEKMRLADLSALDGAISNIRLWTLGSLEEKIIPTKEMINRLRDVLASNSGGGTMELVWGPELKFTESATEVHKFLGSEKYNSVLNAIYAGMGVPPTLTGMAGNGGGFTNNFISLKTLVERLQYGRDLLVEFWEKEVEMVRQAMGFRYAPEIVFDQMSLSDEAAEKNLLIQLADRDIISHETILERFKETPKVEKVRLLREMDDRQKDGTPDKAGPFHDANHPQNIEKMDKQDQFDNKKMDKQFKRDREAQKLDIEQKDRDSKEKTKQAKFTGPPTAPGVAKKPAAKKGNGRPKNTKDTKPRKTRQTKPRSKPGVAEVMIWVEEAWTDVSDLLSLAFVGNLGKKNLRSLTKAETRELEELKIEILSNLEPMSEVTHASIYECLSKNSIDKTFKRLIESEGVSAEEMSVEAYRKHSISAYVEYLTSE